MPPPAFGRVVFSNNRALQSVATYTCNHGYAVVGDTRRHCLESEQWTGEGPTCTVKGECARKPDIVLYAVLGLSYTFKVLKCIVHVFLLFLFERIEAHLPKRYSEKLTERLSEGANLGGGAGSVQSLHKTRISAFIL